jgi:predicted MFS family arabinose efflux permease
VPVGIAAIYFSQRLIRESRAEQRHAGYDIAGAISVTAGLMILVYALVKATDYGWGSGRTLGGIGLAAALIAAFIAIESRAKAPLMPLRVFRNRSITSANLVGLLVGAALFSMFFFISLYLQQVLHYSALKAGVSYLPLAVGIILSAGGASVLVTRLGAKPVLVAGMALVATGLLLFTGVSPHGSYLGDVLPPSVIVAVGLGLSFVPLTILAVAGATDADAGLASGLINTAQQIGGAIGLAILSTIATSRTNDLLHAAHGARGAVPGALTSGFSSAFTVGAGFAIAGIVVALLLVQGRSPSDMAQDDDAVDDARTGDAAEVFASA